MARQNLLSVMKFRVIEHKCLGVEGCCWQFAELKWENVELLHK